MKLKKLLKDIPVKEIKGSKEIEIAGVCVNSKLAAPGHLFIAKRGKKEDGHQYIAEAVEAGAIAVLTDIYDPSLKNITQIIHPDATLIEHAIAARYYQNPSEELFMAGITGTNGKTTTSFLIKHLLDQFEGPCGLIGTIEYIIGRRRYRATHTTPDVVTNHKLLREMILQGCRSAVMEASSHALDQGRVREIHYDVAVFTNLSSDHLDYHHTLEKYAAAKAKLFRSLKGENRKRGASFFPCAILNADCPWSAKMAEGIQARRLTYGILKEADVQASRIDLSASGARFDVKYRGETVECRSPLIGRFNVYNCLAAIAVGLARDEPLSALTEGVRSFSPVPGRLEPIPNELNLKIFVDFAHSGAALEKVLESLREFAKGKIITVFGCGGDRDHLRRSQMAQACQRLSDLAIVTSDNPRSEDPLLICQEIAQAFAPSYSYYIEVDRRRAIEKAVEWATPDDVVLIAGKGHEKYQIFSHKTIEFDDCQAATEACRQKNACVGI